MSRSGRWFLSWVAGLFLLVALSSTSFAEPNLFYRQTDPSDPFHFVLAPSETSSYPDGYVVLSGPAADGSDTRVEYRQVYPPVPVEVTVHEDPRELTPLTPPTHVPGFVSVQRIDFRPLFKEAYLARYEPRIHEGVERRRDYQLIVRREGRLQVELSFASVTGGDQGVRWDGSVRVMNLDRDPEPEIEEWHLSRGTGSPGGDTDARGGYELSIRRFDWNGRTFTRTSEATYSARRSD